MLNRILLPVLATLYCSIFFLSNNWYIYSKTQNIVLVAMGTLICSLVILLTTAIIIIILRLVARTFQKKIDSNYKINELIDPLIVFLSMSLCVILLRNTLAELYLPLVITIPLLLIVVAIARNKINTRVVGKLCVIFEILLVVSTLSLIYKVSSTQPISKWATQNKEFNDQIKFTKKPNVYLIITESYPNKEALEKIYRIDNSKFYKELEKRQFTMHHKYYSNYNITLSSLPSLFGMEHHYYSINIGNFDSIGGRSMLEGNTYNPVIDVFRNNSYKIQFIHSHSGLIPKGASVDYCSPTPPIHLPLEIFLSNQDTTKKSIFGIQKFNFLREMEEQLSFAASKGTPSFTFIYTTQPNHSPSRIKSRNRTKINKILESFREKYNERIDRANVQLLTILDLIFRNDDDPLIILAADHGAWGYRIKEDENNMVISDSLYALDRFGILMGIRFPKDYDHRLDNNFKTHVNLFRNIFAYLSNNNEILVRKVQDDSYDHRARYLAIDDGKILGKYIKLVKKTKNSRSSR